MPTVIIAENLGKKYLLNHQTGHGSYVALRDVLAGGVKNLGRRLMCRGARGGVVQEEFWALRDVSFQVKQGDRIGIIGRNGAGKSTLLKILSRITDPSEGSVRLRGRVASLLEVGTGFHPELTGRENIYLNGAILGMNRSEIRRKFDEIVEFADVARFLDTPVKHFSSGMYVRLAFAVAAHLEPEVLVVDEVLAVGDAQFQKKCLGKMEDAGKQGRTVLFVSHSMAAVNQLCHQGLWLDRGSVKSSGPIASVVEDYMTSGALADGAKTWARESPAPGNDRIRLRAIRTINRFGVPSAQLEMEYPFDVEIEYEILLAQAGMRTGFWVYTLEGVLLFVAGDSEDPAWRDTRRPAGVYRSRCRIPGMLLNSGHFSISVAADIQGSEMLFLEHHVISFQIEHTVFTKLDGASRSPGILCPSLEWHISQLDGD